MKSEFFEKTITVEQRHMDALNHVNNVVWLQWVQDMAEAHWSARTTEEIDRNYYWVVLDHFIAYKKPAVLGDKLVGRTFIEKTEGVRSERHVQFFKDDILCVEAKTNWCLIDKISNRPKRVPEEIVSLFTNTKS